MTDAVVRSATYGILLASTGVFRDWLHGANPYSPM